MKTVAAVVAAVVMIAGSIAIRNRLDGGTPDGPGGGNGGPAAVRLTCATELRTVCQSIAAEADDVEVTVEPAGETFERLVAHDGGDVGLDAWLAPGVWPQMVDGARTRGGDQALFGEVTAAGSTRVGLLAKSLATAPCGTTLTWRCVGDAPLRTIHADGADEASGLLAVAALAVGFHGRNDIGLAELEEDPAFDQWFRAIEKTAPPDEVGGTSRLLIRPSLADAVVDLEALIEPAYEKAATKQQFTVSYPRPTLRAPVTLGLVAGRREERAKDVLGDAAPATLRANGYEASGAGADGDVPLPDPGVLEAMREVWQEASK